MEPVVHIAGKFANPDGQWAALNQKINLTGMRSLPVATVNLSLTLLQ